MALSGDGVPAISEKVPTRTISTSNPMASEEQVAKALTEFLVMKGGLTNPLAVSEAARQLQGMVTGETQQSLEVKIRQLTKTADRPFNVQSGHIILQRAAVSSINRSAN